MLVLRRSTRAESAVMVAATIRNDASRAKPW
jgi:hypothetical protein